MSSHTWDQDRIICSTRCSYQSSICAGPSWCRSLTVPHGSSQLRVYVSTVKRLGQLHLATTHSVAGLEFQRS